MLSLPPVEAILSGPLPAPHAPVAALRGSRASAEDGQARLRCGRPRSFSKACCAPSAGALARGWLFFLFVSVVLRRCVVSSCLVGFAGSRGLPSSAAAGGLVSRLVASVLAAGCSVAVGCCSGADAAVLSAVLASPRFSPSSLSVFSAFGPGGRGSWRFSAVSLVLRAARLGVAVSWWAGGVSSRSLVSRLRGRSRALVASLAASPGSRFVVLVSGGPGASRGSWAAARAALRSGVPVVVFPVGCSLPSPSFLARWSGFPGLSVAPAAASGVWSRGWLLSPPASS